MAHIDALALRILGLQHFGDHVGQLVLERLALLDLLRGASPLELIHDPDGALDAHVGGDERLFDLLVQTAVHADVHRRLQLIGDSRPRFAEVGAQAPEEALALALFLFDDLCRHLFGDDAFEHLMPLHASLLPLRRAVPRGGLGLGPGALLAIDLLFGHAGTDDL